MSKLNLTSYVPCSSVYKLKSEVFLRLFSAEKSPNRVFAVLQDKMLIFDVWTDFMVFNIIPMKGVSPL